MSWSSDIEKPVPAPDVDYTQEDFTRADVQCDLLLDVAGSRSWSDCKRVLEPEATVVIVGAPKGHGCSDR
jgi:NADPH:quinone reductase-like Zn-dependent oxidoreductase